MRKVLLLATLFAILILNGCTKVVSTEENHVQVKIVDESYEPEDVLQMYTGNGWQTMIESAEYNIFVEYEGEQYRIEKSELRMMFEFYYIDDLTWCQVAHRMNQAFPKRRIKYTEDNCRMRHKRFLDENEKDLKKI